MRVYHRGLSEPEQRLMGILPYGNQLDQHQLKHYGIRPQTVRSLIRKRMVQEVVVGKETFYERK